MLEQIAQLVKQYGQQSVVDNPEVPNDINNQVMAAATSTITGGLQNILSGGGLQSLLGLFGNNNQSRSGVLSNPIVAMMVGHLTNKLVQSMGLNPALASNIANNIIPNVLNSLTQRTVSNAPQDNGFDLNDLVGALAGGGTQQATGGLDLQDLLRQFTQGGQVNVDPNVEGQIAQQTQKNQSQGGGLADLIGGFFK